MFRLQMVFVEPVEHVVVTRWVDDVERLPNLQPDTNAVELYHLRVGVESGSRRSTLWTGQLGVATGAADVV